MLDLSKKYLNKDIGSFNLDEISDLQKLIEYHSDLYYNKEAPIISDFEYDELYKKLLILEEKYDIKNKKSSLVGSEILESSFLKVRHTRPMISLDNTYNEDDLKDFDARVNRLLEKSGDKVFYTLEFKFDGLGIELIYKDGLLVQAITRGNGIEGEDVTQNILGIDNIPKKIGYMDDLEVRGEVVMPISSFEELNIRAKIEGTKVFSNPRNAASGSVRVKNANITKDRKLKFFAYDLANFDSFIKKENISNYFDVIKRLEGFGFEISSYFKKLNGIEEVISSINNFGDIKKTIDFEIDGLVLKVNNIKLWEHIGWTEHHPRYAIAYKFPAEILTTRVISIEHSVGRTGTITPVANLEAINIGGVIVKRATLHNYDEVEKLDLRIGDSVFIKRAGEVIPKIISVVKEGYREDFERIYPPKFCPSCNTLVKKDEDKVRYYCPNDLDCPAKHHEKLVFAVGKSGFNIDGLGEKQVELFINEGIITNLASIFKIGEKSEQILELEGFKEKSVNNLIIGVDKAKKVDITTFLTAIGIAGVGKKTAKTISRLFKNEADILNFSPSLEDLENLPDVGPEIASNIVEYFTNDAHKRLLRELLEVLDITYYESKQIDSNSIFSGKKVCITGSFELDGKKIARDDLVKALENVGGEFVSSVSKNTDFLLAGEKSGSKLQKAIEFGVEVIDLKSFYQKI